MGAKPKATGETRSIQVDVMGGDSKSFDLPANYTYYETLIKADCDTGLVTKLNGKDLADLQGTIQDGDRLFVTSKSSAQG